MPMKKRKDLCKRRATVTSTKTPEQMAEEYADNEGSGNETYEHGMRQGFLAGYTTGLERAVRLQASLAEYIQKQNPFDANNHGESINLRIPSDQELHLRAMTSLSIGTSSHTNIQFIPGTGWVKKI